MTPGVAPCRIGHRTSGDGFLSSAGTGRVRTNACRYRVWATPLTCSIYPLTKAPPPETGIRDTAATSRRVILGEE